MLEVNHRYQLAHVIVRSSDLQAAINSIHDKEVVVLVNEEVVAHRELVKRKARPVIVFLTTKDDGVLQAKESFLYDYSLVYDKGFFVTKTNEELTSIDVIALVKTPKIIPPTINPFN